MGKDDQGLSGGGRRYQAIPRVLIFLRNETEVLLIKGAPQKRIWANLYNGVGGHVESGEGVITAARREVREETGITIPDLELRAVVNIDAGDTALGIIMFVFTGWTEQRRTQRTEEGELRWVSIDLLEQYELVEDLDWLLPRILNDRPHGTPLFLRYSYDNKDALVIRRDE